MFSVGTESTRYVWADRTLDPAADTVHLTHAALSDDSNHCLFSPFARAHLKWGLSSRHNRRRVAE